MGRQRRRVLESSTAWESLAREGWGAAFLMPHGMSIVLPVVVRHGVPWRLPRVHILL